ncbi:hypothetical protein HZS55_05110 [Halosimplex rubrum]|uniref:Uncharacterized protein n=1 Tax=Halosimplex rubrum TaxID=869889 RepID=A0A7D5P1I5_9EURY|nr:DUF5812 family protein [Halosimplex rubrum]QLH76721.1 hypothetical protein HZS55_05110 [Halosimplex rubrum]
MKTGTFLVTEADAESAVLRDVSDGQIHTLGSNPDLAVGVAIEGTLAPEPPMDVVWTVEEIDRQFTVSVEEHDEPPTERARETAAAQPVGEVTTHERAGTGEVHVLTVPEESTDSAVADVRDDEATVERAARLGVERVEIRSEPGVVSVRYLP